jgi:ferrous iron transport protein B
MTASLQAWVVTMVVSVCLVYATWTLMPRAWRHAAAARLRRLPGLGRWRALQPKVQAGCGACDGACADACAPEAVVPLKFHRRVSK